MSALALKVEPLPPALMAALHQARLEAKRMFKDVPSRFGDYVHPMSVYEEADRLANKHGLMLVAPVTEFDHLEHPFQIGTDGAGMMMIGKRSRHWILAHVPSGEQYSFYSEVPVDANSSTGGMISFKKASTSEQKDFLCDLFRLRATDEQEGWSEKAQDPTPAASSAAPTESGASSSREEEPDRPPDDSAVGWGEDVVFGLSLLGGFPGGDEKKNAGGEIVIFPPDPTVDDLRGAGWVVSEDGCSAKMLEAMGQTSCPDSVHESLLKDLDAAARRSGRTTEDIKKLFAHCGVEYKKGAECTAYQARLFALCTAKWSGKVA